ncbi:MAG: hypothetical protein GDYSWBUE_001680, partial [Candidatus Fervidibacterota bacterium]
GRWAALSHRLLVKLVEAVLVAVVQVVADLVAAVVELGEHVRTVTKCVRW